MVIMTSASEEENDSSSPSNSSEGTGASNAAALDRQQWLQCPVRETQSAGQSPRSEESSPCLTPSHSYDNCSANTGGLSRSSLANELPSFNSQPIMVPQVSHNYSHRPYLDLSCPVSMSLDSKGSALMSSITPNYSQSCQSEVSDAMSSISLVPPNDRLPFQILDEQEDILVTDPNHFLQNLGLDRGEGILQTKVVSVVGNAGEGKSHALNYLFCDGNKFRTSSNSGTEGDTSNSVSTDVWLFLAKEQGALVLDTPGKAGTGLMGYKTNRLLFKVMAVSDIVIYRTRSERLQSDMFEFLSGFCTAYNDFMKQDLHDLVDKGESEFVSHRPALIICHDTRTTSVIADNGSGTASQQIVATAKRLGFTLDTFCRITYIGSCAKESRDGFGRSCIVPRLSAVLEPTSADREDCLPRLKQAVKRELETTLGRKQRRVSAVLDMLKLLTEKYSEKVGKPCDQQFPQYMFRCQERCLVCASHCSRPMGHQRYAGQKTTVAVSDEIAGNSYQTADSNRGNGYYNDGQDSSPTNSRNRAVPAGRDIALKEHAHFSSTDCKYADEYKNKRYNCSVCLQKGRKSAVLHRPYDSNQSFLQGIVNYAINGYVMECAVCGPIFNSRPQLVCSYEPDGRVVQVEHIHVWPSEPRTGYSTSTHSARQVLEGVQSTVTKVTSTLPNLGITTWLNDKYVNPAYWRPDAECTDCEKCKCTLTAGIHHCRKCGGGYCEQCSSHRMQVPERHWGDQLVRVCVDCYNSPPHPVAKEEPQNTTRQVTETVYGFLSAATSTAADFIRSSTRPDYWEPDEHIKVCRVCQQPFDSVQRVLHHCRDCGSGVCDDCSPHRVPVKRRGWDSNVRVCSTCYIGRSTVQYQDT